MHFIERHHIEGASAEMVAENLDDPKLSAFYKELWRSEAKHGNIFVSMALNYFDEDD